MCAEDPAKNDLQEWVKAEFEQSYEQLRNRDAIIVDITKFYGGLICAVCAAANALFSIGSLPAKGLLIGLFLVLSGSIGLALLGWLIAFRRYFVFAARQLNALRAHATRSLSADEKRLLVVQATDPASPRLWHRESAHIAICLIVSFVNSAVIGAGAFGILHYWLTDKYLGVQFIGGVIVAAIMFAASIAYCKRTLKERP